MFIQGFHHLAVQTHDVERAVHFYRDVLGLPERTRYLRDDGTVRSVWVDLPGGGFLALEACLDAPVPQPFRTNAPGLLLLALRISPSDRRWVEAHLREHGVDVVHQTQWTLYVRDPEGNRIGLSHHPYEVTEG